MISNAIGRCLNALGIVKKEQHYCAWVMNMKDAKYPSKLLFSYLFLFFLYEPLCMSSHDGVADYLCSY
jgi:hypothetical protein